MVSDVSCECSGKQSRSKDGRNVAEISKEELKEIIRKVGRPWHDRRRKISVRRVKSLREVGFSLRQISRLYGVSEATIRRRLKEG